MPDRPIRFLIVDDIAENILALDALLRRDGLEVDHAHSATQALELMLVHDYALALLDVHMPGTDGYELAELMRSTERTRGVPIIFVTAADRDEARRFRGYEAGAVDYIVKPIDPVVLKSKAEVFFRIGRQARDLQRQHDEMQRIAHDRDRAASMLRAHTDNSPLAFVTLDQDLVIRDWSKGAERMFGRAAEDLLERAAADTGWLDEAGAATLAGWLAPGDSAPRHSTEMVLGHAERGPIPCEIYGSILAGSRQRTLSLQILDITERKRAEEVRSLLVGELNHRIKNTLANVQAIARQGLRRSADLADFEQGFVGRLQALSRAHSILSDSTWASAPLDQLIDDQIRVGTLDADRLRRSGPPVELTPDTMLRMALTLHELATNAVKYGALSVPGGMVHLDWVGQGRGIVLTWRETGGPAVIPPGHGGFGSDLIAAVAGGEDGAVVADWRPEGVVWTIRLTEGVTPLDGAAPSAPDGPDPAAGPDAVLRGQSVLVVEDEPLVALDIQAELELAGAGRVRIVRSVDAALSALAEDRFDLALLDGNLKGQPVDAVALGLRRGAVPFCFVSGYGREHLPQGFDDAPLIQKPFPPASLSQTLAQLLHPPSPRAAE
ncbi:Blue-light-activated histidine kinase [Paracoccus haematequi]|uniref:histidine kinase n=1 Tax=Paracoccus haematequi TaxID=2491866 RepID=A0A3S4GN65_9RHOB|nr:response regulator [Paracoccus haematequi]VDS08643.1 Blue-light-activated histidine kinase [Paracoccus haematequi]